MEAEGPITRGKTIAVLKQEGEDKDRQIATLLEALANSRADNDVLEQENEDLKKRHIEEVNSIEGRVATFIDHAVFKRVKVVGTRAHDIASIPASPDAKTAANGVVRSTKS